MMLKGRYLPPPSAESAVAYQLGANSPRGLEVRVADSPIAASSCSLRLPSNMPCHHCSFMRLNSLGTQSCDQGTHGAVWTTEAAVIIRVEAESIGKRGCGLVSSQAAPQRVYSGLFVSRRCCTFGTRRVLGPAARRAGQAPEGTAASPPRRCSRAQVAAPCELAWFRRGESASRRPAVVRWRSCATVTRRHRS